MIRHPTNSQVLTLHPYVVRSALHVGHVCAFLSQADKHCLWYCWPQQGVTTSLGAGCECRGDCDCECRGGCEGGRGGGSEGGEGGCEGGEGGCACRAAGCGCGRGG
jgi:hypothetical protein